MDINQRIFFLESLLLAAKDTGHTMSGVLSCEEIEAIQDAVDDARDKERGI